MALNYQPIAVGDTGSQAREKIETIMTLSALGDNRVIVFTDPDQKLKITPMTGTTVSVAVRPFTVVMNDPQTSNLRSPGGEFALNTGFGIIMIRSNGVLSLDSLSTIAKDQSETILIAANLNGTIASPHPAIQSEIDRYYNPYPEVPEIPDVPLVVQTSGDSTADVMSQKAVTDLVAKAGIATEIVQEMGFSSRAVMSQNTVSNLLKSLFARQELGFTFMEDAEIEIDIAGDFPRVSIPEIYDVMGSVYSRGSFDLDSYWSMIYIANRQDELRVYNMALESILDFYEKVETGAYRIVLSYMNFNGIFGDEIDPSDLEYTVKEHSFTSPSPAIQSAIDRALGLYPQTEVVQETGTCESAVMSQRAVTAGLNTKLDFIAGRWWEESGSSPRAAGIYGSAEALRELPTRLGLGRYLVTDERVRRKLDPADSTKFEDGAPALLDGSMGQCMWCWNAHYYTFWREGERTFEAVSFAPLSGKLSIYVPAGGVSWLGVGVLDRETTTLCSLISDEERYMGGSGTDLSTGYAVPQDAPQCTMLGMAKTYYYSDNWGSRARKRGEGWECNWYIAQAVTEYLTRLVFGTRNIQEAFNPEPDENGLRQGGMGPGMTTLASDNSWRDYNNKSPLLPTSYGVELGDALTVGEYSIYDYEGNIYHTFQVPLFYGLVNAGFGHLPKLVRGQFVLHSEQESHLYVAPSMYAEFSNETIDDKLCLGTVPREQGWVKQVDMSNVASHIKNVEGSNSTYYADYYDPYLSVGVNIPVLRMSGGPSGPTAQGGSLYFAGASLEARHRHVTSPLCYFEEDPSPLPANN